MLCRYCNALVDIVMLCRYCNTLVGFEFASVGRNSQKSLVLEYFDWYS